jgi:hypothetical protein
VRARSCDGAVEFYGRIQEIRSFERPEGANTRKVKRYAARLYAGTPPVVFSKVHRRDSDEVRRELAPYRNVDGLLDRCFYVPAGRIFERLGLHLSKDMESTRGQSLCQARRIAEIPCPEMALYRSRLAQVHSFIKE